MNVDEEDLFMIFIWVWKYEALSFRDLKELIFLYFFNKFIQIHNDISLVAGHWTVLLISDSELGTAMLIR